MSRTPGSLLAIVVFLALALPHAGLAQNVEYVIHVSVDGLRADLLNALLSSDTTGELENFKRLVDEGATTFNARTDFTHTNTIPNHTCMLTGRPVLQPAGQASTVHHGYVSNSDPGPNDTLHNRGNTNLPYVASVFDVAHDNGLSTAAFVSKSKFVIYEQSYDATHGAPDLTPPDDGKDKIDRYLYLSTGFPSNASNLHAAFIAEMRSTKFNYVFVHYRDPDSAGHAGGWGSTLWETSVKRVDDYLGEIFQMVEESPEFNDRTAIILTADHGGQGFGHSNPSLVSTYTIPVFVWGPGVAAGFDLYSLNSSTRANPASGRPDYNAVPQPIRDGETGNLALDLLGLPAVPGSTINGSQDLRVTGEVAVEKKNWSRLKGAFR